MRAKPGGVSGQGGRRGATGRAPHQRRPTTAPGGHHDEGHDTKAHDNGRRPTTASTTNNDEGKEGRAEGHNAEMTTTRDDQRWRVWPTTITATYHSSTSPSVSPPSLATSPSLLTTPFMPLLPPPPLSSLLPPSLLTPPPIFFPFSTPFPSLPVLSFHPYCIRNPFQSPTKNTSKPPAHDPRFLSSLPPPTRPSLPPSQRSG